MKTGGKEEREGGKRNGERGRKKMEGYEVQTEREEWREGEGKNSEGSREGILRGMKSCKEEIEERERKKRKIQKEGRGQ